ncbi:MAG: hypothetical protein ACJ8MR_12655 [Povalibacter sp.]
MRNLTRSLSSFAGVVILTATSLVHADDVARAGVSEAVWMPQTISFTYRSEGRTYSCSILEYKISMILKRLGAREELEVRNDGCRDLATRATFQLFLASPVEATQENIHRVTEYSSQDELIARLHATKLPSSNDVERFPAAWESISFRRDRRLEIEAADCALIQQLRRQVLPKMSIQVTSDITNLDCSQELTGIARPRLVVEALLPVSSLQ